MALTVPLQVALAVTGAGVLQFGYKYLDRVASGVRSSVLTPFIEEMTAVYGIALLLMVALPAIRRHPLAGGAFARRLPLYAVGALAISAAHTSLNWLSRSALFATLGRVYNYGEMPARYAMELPMDLMVFTIFVAGVHAWDHIRRARTTELHAAQAQGRLLEAELRNLRSKLEPHFLFNALNTISETMYENPAAADEMIGHLSDLLRASMRSNDVREVSVATELLLLTHYVALVRARFGEALDLSLNVTDGIENSLLPPMVIQPLVENAIRHGNIGRCGRGRIVVSVTRKREQLSVVVHDDGPGIASGSDPFDAGVGLSATRDRLALLYGPEQSIVAANDPAGGFGVSILLPFSVGRTASAVP